MLVRHMPRHWYLSAAIRGTLVLAAALTACAWANTVLHVTKTSVATILDADDWPEASEPPEEPTVAQPPEEVPQQPTDTTSVESQAVKQEKAEQAISEAQSNPKLPEPPAVNASPPNLPPADVSADEPLVASADESENAVETAASPEPLNDQAPPQDLDRVAAEQADSARPAAAPELFTAAEGGELGSFNLPGAGDSPTVGDAAPGNGLVCVVGFAKLPTPESLRSIPWGQLVVIRHGRQGIELATVDGRAVSPPMSVAEFLRTRPQFALRQGIVLDRAVISRVADRLVTDGGGWTPWLVVSDQVFASWQQEVLRELERSGVARQDAKRIHAQLIWDARRGDAAPRIVVTQVERRSINPSEQDEVSQ